MVKKKKQNRSNPIIAFQPDTDVAAGIELALKKTATAGKVQHGVKSRLINEALRLHLEDARKMLVKIEEAIRKTREDALQNK